MFNSGKTFLSKKAGSFSGVPQRTVQAWTERNLLEVETTGQGDKRKYDVLNCVEIAIIESLRKNSLPISFIAKVMKHLRRNDNLKKFIEESDVAFLNIFITGGGDATLYDDSGIGYSDGDLNEGIDTEIGQRVSNSWRSATMPLNYDKAIILNITKISKRVLDKIE